MTPGFQALKLDSNFKEGYINVNFRINSGKMFEGQICQYYQTGFCKFRETCRKRHESKICQENHDYKSCGCSLRHPKICRSYKREGTCRFKDDCAYAHKNDQDDPRNQSHTQEIMNIQAEMIQMKDIIMQLQNKIEILKNVIE